MKNKNLILSLLGSYWPYLLIKKYFLTKNNDKSTSWHIDFKRKNYLKKETSKNKKYNDKKK